MNTVAAPPLGAPTAEQQRPDSWLMPFAVFGLFMFLPPAGAFLVFDYSQKEGLFVAGALAILLTIFRSRAANPVAPGIVVSTLIMLHFIPTMFVAEVDIQRAILSLLLLVILMVSAGFVGNWLFETPDQDVIRITAYLRAIMIVIAILAMLGLQPPSGVVLPKPTFPFREPSHYCLVLIPLLIHVTVTSRIPKRLAWIGFSFVLAYLLENLTLVVASALAALIVLPMRYLVPAGLLLFSILGLLNIDYFVERLDFNAHTRSLSALVYLQGWDILRDSFRQTLGWGFGFQQLGFVDIRSAAGDRILMLYGEDTNVTDGGFMAAKLAGELGLLGLGAIVAFTILALRLAWRLRRIAFGVEPASHGQILAFAIIVGYLIDMFVRGTGYFSASSALALIALHHVLGKRGQTSPRDVARQTEPPDFRVI